MTGVKRRRINNVLDKFSLLWHYLNQTTDGERGYSMVKDYKRFRSEVRKGLHKVTITIPDEALDWFYKLSKMMKKKKGYKLPRSYIIRSLINVCMKLDINVEGVRTEKDLEERILRAIKKY